MCDIGSGYGETARMLAAEWGVGVTALTLSPAQYAYAQALSPSSDNPTYLFGNWLTNKLPSEQFDTALSIGSSEHMENKPLFFEEAFRVLKPNGKIVICAWLAASQPNKFEIKYPLEPICREGCLPST